jgi:hypothetical protein
MDGYGRSLFMLLCAIGYGVVDGSLNLAYMTLLGELSFT